MKACCSNRKGAKDKDDTDGMLVMTTPSGMGMAGTPEVGSTLRDPQKLEAKDSAPLNLLARVRGSLDPRAVEARELDAEQRETQGYAKEALTVASLAEAAENASRPELSSRKPYPSEVENFACVRPWQARAVVMEGTTALDSGKMGNARAEQLPPGRHVRVPLVVGKDTVEPTVSLLTIEGRVGNESVEPAPLSSAEFSRLHL
eukprot:3130881-Pleurochrysis_carterae.AAC.2